MQVSGKGILVFCLMLSAGLSGCQYCKTPPVLPVFEFAQRPATVVRPSSFHACGNALFPCDTPQVLITRGDRRGKVQTIRK